MWEVFLEGFWGVVVGVMGILYGWVVIKGIEMLDYIVYIDVNIFGIVIDGIVYKFGYLMVVNDLIVNLGGIM